MVHEHETTAALRARNPAGKTEERQDEEERGETQRSLVRSFSRSPSTPSRISSSSRSLRARSGRTTAIRPGTPQQSVEAKVSTFPMPRNETCTITYLLIQVLPHALVAHDLVRALERAVKCAARASVSTQAAPAKSPDTETRPDQSGRRLTFSRSRSDSTRCSDTRAAR